MERIELGELPVMLSDGLLARSGCCSPGGRRRRPLAARRTRGPSGGARGRWPSCRCSSPARWRRSLIQGHPDAALAQGLYPLGRLDRGPGLAVLFAAVALAGALLAAGWRSLEPAGWRLAAAFGLALLLAATWAAELLRTGEGPASALGVLRRSWSSCARWSPWAPPRPSLPAGPLLAVAAGLALLLYGLLLPAQLARALAAHGQWLTLAAAALLLARRPLVPPQPPPPRPARRRAARRALPRPGGAALPGAGRLLPR